MSPRDKEHGHGEHQHGEMIDRGAGRPGMDEHMDEHTGGSGQSDPQEHGGEMGPDHRKHMLQQHHRKVLWVYWLVIILGFWLLVAPSTFGYGSYMAQPSGGRSVWLSDEARVAAMRWSDVLSGLALIVLGWLSLKPNRPVAVWACCFVGIWLNMAPLVFWCPSPAAYLNDTLVGTLIITLTVLIPGMPNMIMFMKMGPSVPQGWSYNPSSWAQRSVLIATSLAGWLVSRYLAAFQLGYIDRIWEPFFGQGTVRVLNSDVSHAWPVSDAGLGALTYTFELLMVFMGSQSRWRTMPWMVALFGLLVIPLGLAHILLVISQPVLVGSWCTLCLLAAAIMLPMIPLEVDEVIAMGQDLAQSRRQGESLWHAFWKGGAAMQGEEDRRTPDIAETPAHPWRVFEASLWGMSVPWTLLVSTVLGIWLMFAPAALGTAKPAASVDHLVGALVVTFSVICMAEVIRIGRYINVLLGVALLVLPWLLSGSYSLSLLNDLLVGLAIIALAIPRGPKRERYGLWDRFVR